MSLRDHIDETRPKSAWRVAAGAFVVAVALAAIATLDGSLFGLDLSEPITRVLFCIGAGVLPAAVALVRAKR